jgi:hypothetical protein
VYACSISFCKSVCACGTYRALQHHCNRIGIYTYIYIYVYALFASNLFKDASNSACYIVSDDKFVSE